MGLHTIILPKKSITLASILFVSAMSTQTFALQSNDVRYLEVGNHDSKPASRLKVIASVKRNYEGRILSVRKKYQAADKDCHHVKIIDTKGEILNIHVNCE